jgi:hypothetical protein
MPKPLRLFIRPPYRPSDIPAGPWSLVHGFGPEAPISPSVFQTVHSHVLLRTSGSGEFFAANDGLLSVRPPGTGGLDPREEFEMPGPSDPPSTITLYLHMSPLRVGPVSIAFDERAAPINGVTGFAYLNVAVASLGNGLRELLDSPVLGGSALSREEVVNLLVRGLLDVWVTGGHAIGQASTNGAPAGQRQLGFTALTTLGPMDPSHVYDWMRDFLEDGQSDLDGFLALAPKRWPVISPGVSAADAIDLTNYALYPMTVLQELRVTHHLTPEQWRLVGDNQKQQWRRRLLARTGQASPGATDPPFAFDDIDRRNVFQIEAVVEFYANFDDPWAAGAAPRAPDAANYVTANFLDLEGSQSIATGNRVTLDGEPALSGVRAQQDTIFLERDTARPSRLYRITAVDDANDTLTLDGTPAIAGGTTALTPWRIRARPVLVVIDSFGARLSGLSATVANPGTPDVVTLDGAPDLSRVNANFDTIYLPADTARPSRTYRITVRSDAAKTVTLDAAPVLADGASAWHIPGGVGGTVPPFTSGRVNALTGGPLGFDHYDGVVFVVYEGAVRAQYRWTSYTSRTNANAGHLSSIRGNRRYDYASLRGADDFRNYGFGVRDPGAAFDGVREARYYFQTPVLGDTAVAPAPPADPGLGKIDILFHDGSTAGRPGTGSAGCLVSPDINDLRDVLIGWYQHDFEAVNTPGALDTEVARAHGLDRIAAQALWNLPTGLSAANWNNRIRGTCWLIRPDERPL